MGVPTYSYKLMAFAISCSLAGLAGGIHALFVNYVTAGDTFIITVPLTVVLMSVLGGTRHWAGPAVGAIAITCLLYAFTAGDSALAGKAVFGALLGAVILFMPNGILGFFLKKTHQKNGPAAAQLPSHESGQTTVHTYAPASEPTPPRKPVASPSGKPLLEVRNLVKAFSRACVRWTA